MAKQGVKYQFSPLTWIHGTAIFPPHAIALQNHAEAVCLNLITMKVLLV